MYPLKEVGFKDILNSFGLKTSNTLEQTLVESLKFYKKSKKLTINLKAMNVIHQEELYQVKKQFKKKNSTLNDVEVNISYKLSYESLEELIKLNWENIFFILKKEVPSVKAVASKITWKLSNNQLTIEVADSFVAVKMRERHVDRAIKGYFEEHFRVKLKCSIVDNNNDFDFSTYEIQKEKENVLFLNQIKRETVQNQKLQHHKQGKSQNASTTINTGSLVLLGKNFTGNITKLGDLKEDSERVIIECEVFHIEDRELRSGKTLIIINVTDYTNSITVKIFEGEKQPQSIKELLSPGEHIRIKGDIVYDKFVKENILMATDIVRIGKVVNREDLAEEKRIELHMHTQMSAMDGLSSTKDLIARAAKWGHKAVSITDHGVVQAYPDAMEAAKDYNIKVIYGMEGYMVNDEANLVDAPDDPYSLDDEYVIFDIETTGLSNINDRITEIGAVKIINGKKVDAFSALVNPERPIPAKIIELTGITNDMVKDAPSIEEILPEFLNFVGESCIVAHNADFDVGFIRENAKRLKRNLNNPVVDTLKLSRVLLGHLKRHKLNTVAKELKVTLENHHRAVDDAKATTEIFIKLIEKMKDKDIFTLQDINTHLGKKVDVTKLDTYHIMLLAKNATGLKNLYKIVSESHLQYFYKKPRIPKSLLNKFRDGIIVGSACEAGELFQAVLNNLADVEIEKIAKYYDYLEIQPVENNKFLIDKGMVKSFEDIQNMNKRIVTTGEKLGIPVVGTGDVHFLDKHDEYYRRILMTGQGFQDADQQPPLYLKTTEEMLQEFEYLGTDKAKEIVVTNPAKINGEVEELLPIPNGTFPPKIEGSEEELRRLCYGKAERIYGSPLPEIVQARLDRELNSIISNGYAVMYIIAHKLVTKSLEDGYLVGSRGSVGSSFAATMSDITEVNPLPPHYVCPTCKASEFITDGSYGSGADLPNKKCTNCGEQLIKDGHDIPFEVFLGFEGDKEPDIDLNFAGEYQSQAQKYTEELFGEGKVFRAGTIGTIADKTAYGFAKKYLEEKEIHYTSAEVNRLTKGCTGVKRTSGQHPGGLMIIPSDSDVHEFTPVQYPANDASSGVITTHFDYHAISGRLLKLDNLGHDVPTIIKMLEDITNTNVQTIPLDDKDTMSIFTSTDALQVNKEDFNYEVGTLGIPEFGTKFVRQMLIDTQPSTFGELVRISGLSHGTDVWLNNAQELVRANVAELKDVISTRDDIMNYLILKGLPAKASFKIMEKVRKGKGLTPEDEELMKEHKVPEWYIDSCKKIKYMFPKAHAAAYVMMSFRIAYYKVHYPEAFYATYFTMKAEDFDADLVVKGKDVIKEKVIELEAMGNNMTAKEKNLLTVLEVALEMYSRGIYLLPVDIYTSDADKFTIVEGKLLPPLKALQGVGQNAARSIVEARGNGGFLSLEDLRERTKVTKTVVETLVKHGCIGDLPKTNQLSLF